MTINELTQYYSQRLAYEYRGLARADAQMQLYVKQFVADYLANQLTTCYALDQAVGTQLDVLGKYIGLSRNIGLPALNSAFGFWTYSSTFAPNKYQGSWSPVYNSPTIPAAAPANNGYWYIANYPGVSTSPIAATFKAGDAIWSNGSVWAKSSIYNGNGLTTYNDAAANANATFYQYSTTELQNTALPDDQYRAVLQLKIISNVSNHTLASLVDNLWAVFGNLIQLVDNADMTITYNILGLFPLSVPLLVQYLPRPMGVGITVNGFTPPPPPVTTSHITTQAGNWLVTESGDSLITE